MSNLKIDTLEVLRHMMPVSRIKSVVASLSIFVGLGLAQASAATISSYLLIQADFSSATAGLETYKFKVTYDSSLLTSPTPLTGLSLLNIVFGAPVVAGGTPANGQFYSTSNSSFGVMYQYFSSFGYSVQQFFINGLNGPQSLSVAPYDYWNYLVAGGDSEGNPDGFDDGSWQYSWDDGAGTRYLADGSYDAWTFGSMSSDPYYVDVTGTGNLPTTADFSNVNQLLFSANGFTVYTTPEPGRMVLLAFGVCLVALRRRRE